MVVEDGRYTGDIAFYAYGEGKAVAIRELARQRGYDLADCWAYSDSWTDRPMLELVGNPVAVNPDKALRRHAAEVGWRLLEFRRPVRMRSRLARVPPRPARPWPTPAPPWRSVRSPRCGGRSAPGALTGRRPAGVTRVTTQLLTGAGREAYQRHTDHRLRADEFPPTAVRAQDQSTHVRPATRWHVERAHPDPGRRSDSTHGHPRPAHGDGAPPPGGAPFRSCPSG